VTVIKTLKYETRIIIFNDSSDTLGDILKMSMASHSGSGYRAKGRQTITGRGKEH